MNRHEAAYRKEWATLTGKSEREIYVPVALRDPEPELTLEELRAALTGQGEA